MTALTPSVVDGPWLLPPAPLVSELQLELGLGAIHHPALGGHLPRGDHVTSPEATT